MDREMKAARKAEIIRVRIVRERMKLLKGFFEEDRDLTFFEKNDDPTLEAYLDKMFLDPLYNYYKALIPSARPSRRQLLQ